MDEVRALKKVVEDQSDESKSVHAHRRAIFESIHAVTARIHAIPATDVLAVKGEVESALETLLRSSSGVLSPPIRSCGLDMLLSAYGRVFTEFGLGGLSSAEKFVSTCNSIASARQSMTIRRRQYEYGVENRASCLLFAGAIHGFAGGACVSLLGETLRVLEGVDEKEERLGSACATSVGWVLDGLCGSDKASRSVSGSSRRSLFGRRGEKPDEVVKGCLRRCLEILRGLTRSGGAEVRRRVAVSLAYLGRACVCFDAFGGVSAEELARLLFGGMTDEDAGVRAAVGWSLGSVLGCAIFSAAARESVGEAAVADARAAATRADATADASVDRLRGRVDASAREDVDVDLERAAEWLTPAAAVRWFARLDKTTQAPDTVAIAVHTLFEATKSLILPRALPATIDALLQLPRAPQRVGLQCIARIDGGCVALARNSHAACLHPLVAMAPVRGPGPDWVVMLAAGAESRDLKICSAVALVIKRALEENRSILAFPLTHWRQSIERLSSELASPLQTAQRRAISVSISHSSSPPTNLQLPGNLPSTDDSIGRPRSIPSPRGPGLSWLHLSRRSPEDAVSAVEASKWLVEDAWPGSGALSLGVGQREAEHVLSVATLLAAATTSHDDATFELAQRLLQRARDLRDNVYADTAPGPESRSHASSAAHRARTTARAADLETACALHLSGWLLLRALLPHTLGPAIAMAALREDSSEPPEKRHSSKKAPLQKHDLDEDPPPIDPLEMGRYVLGLLRREAEWVRVVARREGSGAEGAGGGGAVFRPDVVVGGCVIACGASGCDSGGEDAWVVSAGTSGASGALRRCVALGGGGVWEWVSVSAVCAGLRDVCRCVGPAAQQRGAVGGVLAGPIQEICTALVASDVLPDAAAVRAAKALPDALGRVIRGQGEGEEVPAATMVLAEMGCVAGGLAPPPVNVMLARAAGIEPGTEAKLATLCGDFAAEAPVAAYTPTLARLLAGNAAGMRVAALAVRRAAANVLAGAAALPLRAQEMWTARGPLTAVALTLATGGVAGADPTSSGLLTAVPVDEALGWNPLALALSALPCLRPGPSLAEFVGEDVHADGERPAEHVGNGGIDACEPECVSADTPRWLVDGFAAEEDVLSIADGLEFGAFLSGETDGNLSCGSAAVVPAPSSTTPKKLDFYNSNRMRHMLFGIASSSDPLLCCVHVLYQTLPTLPTGPATVAWGVLGAAMGGHCASPVWRASGSWTRPYVASSAAVAAATLRRLRPAGDDDATPPWLGPLRAAAAAVLTSDDAAARRAAARLIAACARCASARVARRKIIKAATTSAASKLASDSKQHDQTDDQESPLSASAASKAGALECLASLRRAGFLSTAPAAAEFDAARARAPPASAALAAWTAGMEAAAGDVSSLAGPSLALLAAHVLATPLGLSTARPSPSSAPTFVGIGGRLAAVSSARVGALAQLLRPILLAWGPALAADPPRLAAALSLWAWLCAFPSRFVAAHALAALHALASSVLGGSAASHAIETRDAVAAAIASASNDPSHLPRPDDSLITALVSLGARRLIQSRPLWDDGVGSTPCLPIPMVPRPSDAKAAVRAAASSTSKSSGDSAPPALSQPPPPTHSNVLLLRSHLDDSPYDSQPVWVALRTFCDSLASVWAVPCLPPSGKPRDARVSVFLRASRVNADRVRAALTPALPSFSHQKFSTDEKEDDQEDPFDRDQWEAAMTARGGRSSASPVIHLVPQYLESRCRTDAVDKRLWDVLVGIALDVRSDWERRVAALRTLGTSALPQHVVPSAPASETQAAQVADVVRLIDEISRQVVDADTSTSLPDAPASPGPTLSSPSPKSKSSKSRAPLPATPASGALAAASSLLAHRTLSVYCTLTDPLAPSSSLWVLHEAAVTAAIRRLLRAETLPTHARQAAAWTAAFLPRAGVLRDAVTAKRLVSSVATVAPHHKNTSSSPTALVALLTALRREIAAEALQDLGLDELVALIPQAPPSLLPPLATALVELGCEPSILAETIVSTTSDLAALLQHPSFPSYLANEAVARALLSTKLRSSIPPSLVESALTHKNLALAAHLAQQVPHLSPTFALQLPDQELARLKAVPYLALDSSSPIPPSTPIVWLRQAIVHRTSSLRKSSAKEWKKWIPFAFERDPILASTLIHHHLATSRALASAASTTLRERSIPPTLSTPFRAAVAMSIQHALATCTDNDDVSLVRLAAALMTSAPDPTSSTTIAAFLQTMTPTLTKLQSKPTSAVRSQCAAIAMELISRSKHSFRTAVASLDSSQKQVWESTLRTRK